ncbi:hypothetical protein [Nonomuraea jabiensis]|uniref:TctA family transporter n=1 Tax=Nonomuraea jabiensis TaxID=882448 RepID=A0A7W9FXJ9_9ACTN|nr:hypothetical protein [Nonomuraea jabiensis]MBB5773415.1 TctA family transporter [Nonomuraea jabiensis]
MPPHFRSALPAAGILTFLSYATEKPTLVRTLPGFGMRRFGLPVLPVLPVIVGVILGPRAELQGRRSPQLPGGPVSDTVYAAILVLPAWPLLRRCVGRG